MSSDQSVPKYLCPKCVGATGWTSVVKMVMSGNSWIIDLAPVEGEEASQGLDWRDLDFIIKLKQISVDKKI